MKWSFFAILFCLSLYSPVFGAVDVASVGANQVQIFPSQSVTQRQITMENRAEFARQLSEMRRQGRGSKNPVVQNSVHIVDGMLRLIKYGFKRPDDAIDALVAKADSSQEKMDGVALITKYGQTAHIDLMVVAPWHLDKNILVQSPKYRNVGKSMIEFLLLNGFSTLTLDPAGKESEEAYRAMGFESKAGAIGRRLVLEGAAIPKLLLEMKSKRSL